MTKRRLINKKAYDEMLLLKKLVSNDNENMYVVSLQIDENENEGFVIDHIYLGNWKATIVGENYTESSKILINYLSNLK